MFNNTKMEIVHPQEALVGREQPLFQVGRHRVLNQELQELKHYPHRVFLGMGCFWGAERLLWQQKGVLLTAAGYAGGYTRNPGYDEVCTGETGHTEVVAVAYDPEQTSLEQLLRCFWEQHDPTQGMRQGNDRGTQYRSAIYFDTQDSAAQQALTTALASRDAYQQQLTQAGLGTVTTEIRCGVPFYFAEPYHQQYLDANPGGYCGLKGTGVNCPV